MMTYLPFGEVNFFPIKTRNPYPESPLEATLNGDRFHAPWTIAKPYKHRYEL